jgi:hypothetical protein
VSRLLLTRGLDASERTRSLVDDGVPRSRAVLQAQDFGLGGGDGADSDGSRGGGCLLCHRTGVFVFKVEPVVAVLHAEDVSLDIVVVADGRCTGLIQAEIQEAALDVEETACEVWR